MKLFTLGICLVLVSAAVLARDLSTLARQERARRRAIEAAGRSATEFTDEDLEAYDAVDQTPSPDGSAGPRRRRRERDLSKERAYWRTQRVRHERELATLDLRIRKLEARLAEHRARRNSKIGALRDPSAASIEDSLQHVREEKERLELRFRERARKDGALPGWLR